MYPNIKFHENPAIGSQVVPCGRTDGRTDVTKPRVAFHNLVNAPKNFLGFAFGSEVILST